MRRLVSLALIALTAAVLALAATRTIPFAAMAESWLADYRVATLLPAEPQDSDIIIVTIDEATLSRFPYRSPVDRAFLAGLVRTLERHGVRAIGIDMLFDQPTEPAKDAALKEALDTAAVPLVVGFAGESEGLTPEQAAWIGAFVAPRLRGWANLVKDGWDGTVRSTFPGQNAGDGTWISGLVVALAERLRVTSSIPEPMPIAWHGQPSLDIPPFRRIPATTVGILPPAWFKGRIALIGADLSLTDRHRTPFATSRRGPGALTPGVEVHAHALAQLLNDRPSPVPTTAVVGTMVILAAVTGVALSMLPGGPVLRALAGTGLTAGLWIGVFIAYHTAGLLLPLIAPTLALGGALWAADGYGHRHERKMRKFVVDAFSRYVSPNVVAGLVADPTSLKLGGERRDISIIFTDVADFTTLSERTDPEVLGRLVNAYLGGVSKIVLEHDGTIVDFIGDAVLAIFNAPLSVSDHCARAVACVRAIDAFSNDFRSQGQPAELNWGITRIGVHAGPVLIGNFGADLRCKYTPVGDAVNTASRLEGVNKYVGTRMLASTVMLSEAEKTQARPVGQLVLKGRSEPLGVFELLEPAEARSDYMHRYRAAYQAFEQGDISLATTAFTALAEERPDDGCVAVHCGRLREGRDNVQIHLRDK